MPLVNRIQHNIPLDLATGPRNTRIYLVKRCEALHSFRRSRGQPSSPLGSSDWEDGWQLWEWVGCVAQTGVPCQDLHPLHRRKPAEVAGPRSVTEDVPQSFSIVPKTCLEEDGRGLACPPELGREGAGVLQGLHSGAVHPLLPRVHTCVCTHTHPCSSPWSPDCPPSSFKKTVGS